MTRILTVGAAQLGPIARAESRTQVVRRLIAILDRAKARGCKLVVFPELALTTFFPRWFMPDQAEVDTFFEREMPSNETAPLFNEAKRLGLGFSLGYAELTPEGGLEIVGMASHESRGLKKGVVVNIEATVSAIQRALEEAELMADCKIREVYTGIAGSHISAENCKGVVALKKAEVTREDIHRAIESARTLAVIPHERRLKKIILILA